jgi:hypothetical protein
MNDSRVRFIAANGLVIGAIFGVGGTFASSAGLRGLAWGVDGSALVLAAALLTIHHVRRGNDLAAAGFLVFLAGETLIVSGSAMDLLASVPVFGAGAGLWAVSMALVSASGVMPSTVRAVGFGASMLFAIVAAQIFLGTLLTPLSRPLPFFAYPFLALTLLGWAWAHTRGSA